MDAKPVVVIDGRMIGKVGHGIGNYVSDLILGLSEIDRDLPYEPVFLIQSAMKDRDLWRGFRTQIIHAPFLNPSEMVEVPKRLKSLKASLYHSTSFASLPYCPCDHLQTIHDLNHLQFGSFQKRAYYRVLVRAFAKKAKSLLTVSEFARDELATWLAWHRDTIQVVPNAIPVKTRVSAEKVEEILNKHQLQKGKYFFTLASVKSHKNLNFLVDTYREFTRGQMGDSWPLVMPVAAESFGGKNLLCIGGLGGEEMQGLLQGAGALLVPSLYEGFGRPPLEAILAGVPLLVSDIPAHREVLMGVASEDYRMLSPHDRAAWWTALAEVQSGDLHEAQQQSRDWVVQQYSVVNLAKKMDGIYRDTLLGP